MILSISPIEFAAILNNPLPSPLNKDAVTDPLINVFDFICRDDPLGTPIVFVSTADAVKFPTTLTDSDEAFIIGLPLTKRDILFTLFKFKPFGSLPLNCIPFTFYFYDTSSTETTTSAEFANDEVTDIKSFAPNTNFCSPPTKTLAPP